jgi:tripartite-type tricarboxylate transporter receptor subunit TctC
MFDPLNTSVPHIKAGRLKAIGIGTLERSKTLPDVPTISESGLKGYEAATWIGVLAPAGTPKEIVARMNREIVKVLHLPDVQEKLSSQGAEPVGSTPEQFDAFMKAELEKWGAVIRKAKVPAVQ